MRRIDNLEEQLDVAILAYLGPDLANWLLEEGDELLPNEFSLVWSKFSQELRSRAYREGFWVHDHKRLAKTLEKGSTLHPFYTERRGNGWRVLLNMAPSSVKKEANA